MKKFISIFFIMIVAATATTIKAQSRTTTKFNNDWKFSLGDEPAAIAASFNDAAWRSLNLPHDWSIEFPFDSTSPTGTGGGALRGGIGWYRKTFTLPEADKTKNIFIDFDGVYRNSEVFINGHSLGIRPNGYISFRYDLTPFLKFGKEKNVIAVKVDNSQQPNSRWYSGSGIYRNVWLIKTGRIYVDKWGTFITASLSNPANAKVNIATRVRDAIKSPYTVRNLIYNKENKLVASQDKALFYIGLDTRKRTNLTDSANSPEPYDAPLETAMEITIANPQLWSIENPYLYKAVTQIISGGKVVDEYTTAFGVRTFRFDADKGFFLNDKQVKIIGVCNHHDLGCLGTAINTRALERQLQILKGMGINGIRTSHNPPAPELLDLCDKMGFIVMDEAFDMWKKGKTKYDYSIDFDKWHTQDLTDHILRDRNHPSVFIWSIGNEIQEQWGSEADLPAIKNLLTELHNTVKKLDDRPTVAANNETNPWNRLLQSDVTDMIGYNYNLNKWAADSVQARWGRKPFIITESVSALQSRGHYDMPSDSMRLWPKRWDIPVENANPDWTCSAYENCTAPWGSTHIENIKALLKNDNVSGMYIWTGFDYIGEPTPYPWPARSSYFGIVDLAGFPKDAYYLYQSVFTKKSMLHLFPHWNWKEGQTIDMWAYYNNADEAELFINGKSQGIKKKTGEGLHVMWRVKFEPGTVKAVTRKNGKVVLVKEIKSAGAPAKIILSADRNIISANGEDLSFVTAKIVDKDGNLVPDADNLVKFSVKGEGFIAGTDNGWQTDLTSFKSNDRHAFNGLCLAVLQANNKVGQVQLTASANDLAPATIIINTKK